MKRDAAQRLPLYLSVHAFLGAAIGAAAGAVLVATDVIGLASLAQDDLRGFILIPALAGLFALCTAASALDLLTPKDGSALPACRADQFCAVRLQLAPRE